MVYQNGEILLIINFFCLLNPRVRKRKKAKRKTILLRTADNVER